MFSTWREHISVGRRGACRRGFLKTISAGSLAAGTLSFGDALALQAADLQKRHKSLIVLWMSGGPSQMETFDPKPHTETGGSTEAIETAVPGIRVAEHWEKLAASMNDIALIRSLNNKEGNHQRATYQLHTSYLPIGSVKHPSVGSSIAQQLGRSSEDLPSVVTIGGRESGLTGGFLGVDFEPFLVNNPGKLPDNVSTVFGQPRFERRLDLLKKLEAEQAARGGESVVQTHVGMYDKAAKLVLSPDTKTFDLSSEPDSVTARYGDSAFGKGCLLARRLVEAGVSCVEVRLNGWDTHEDVFNKVGKLAKDADPACAALIADLKARGLLEDTLVVWMGEFGRTPKINPRTGRDHFPKAFNGWLAGGGIKGGQVIGSTNDDGTTIKDNPVSAGDLLASICHSLGVNHRFEHMSPIGRPLRIVDKGEPIKALFS